MTGTGPPRFLIVAPGAALAAAVALMLPVVRAALALPPSRSDFGGELEVVFTYRLLHGGAHIPDRPVAELGITDDTVLDLEVDLTVSGPTGPIGETVFRTSDDASTGVPANAIRALARAAFHHLRP